MFLTSFRPLLLCCAGLVPLVSCADSTVTVKPDHANGSYALNEKVTWQVVATGDASALTAVPYTVKRDGTEEVAKGTLDLSKGPATITASLAVPGALVAELPPLVAPPPGTFAKPLAASGAVVGADQLAPAAPAPADFDAFWQGKLQELAKVPPNPVVEKGDASSVKNSDDVDYYKVTLDNVGGTHVYGQLARPKVGDKFPAILMLQFAGVYPLDKGQVVGAAKPGWLALNISAHDLPIDNPPEFYADLKKGALKDYMYIGSESRDTSYFLRMFLGCVQAEKYLASRPDWNGKVLVVTGTSQGGLQSFVTAGLCPEVTHLMVLVPAGCDYYAPKGTPPRAFGWPYWLSNWGPKNRDMAKVETTAGYFDGGYFAARVHCPSLVAVALLDIAARPAGVIAAYNSIKASKQLILMPASDHYGSGGAQADFFTAFNGWKTALKFDRPLPIPAADAVPVTK